MVNDKKIREFFDERTGFTDNPNEAIYVLRDGTLVSGGYEDGIRGEDHAIAEGLIEIDRYDNSFWSKLHFETDFVRLTPETKIALIMENQKLNPFQENVIKEGGYVVEEYCPSYEIEQKEIINVENTKDIKEAQAFLERMEFNLDETFRYQMLGRLQSDCEVYLGDSPQNHRVDRLWADSEMEQIAVMKNLYLSFPADKRPEWIDINDIEKYETMMVKSRVEELANKIGLKENGYCLEKMPEWIENSKSYADKMIKNKAMDTKDVKEIRLTYLLNKLCPNLHHYKQKPFGTESIEVYNKMMNDYTMENSQAEFLDKNGKIVQKGVEKSPQEFDKFIAVMEKHIDFALKGTPVVYWFNDKEQRIDCVALGKLTTADGEKVLIAKTSSGESIHGPEEKFQLKQALVFRNKTSIKEQKEKALQRVNKDKKLIQKPLVKDISK